MHQTAALAHTTHHAVFPTNQCLSGCHNAHAPCCVRVGRALTIKAVTSCSSACMSVHACGNTCAYPATLSAPSSQHMHLPIPHISDISAAMQQAPHLFSHALCQASMHQIRRMWLVACSMHKHTWKHMGIHVGVSEHAHEHMAVPCMRTWQHQVHDTWCGCCCSC